MPPRAPDPRWKRVKSLLESARELSPADREAFLLNECGDDPSIRKEVESLIRHGTDSDFLPVPEVSELGVDMTVNLEGQKLGPWLVERRIAKGGMGAVYLARRDDGEFRKQVAIKVVRQRVATDAALRRFRAERQILAEVEHPNIARLLDAGTTDDGLPYLVMEYVEGVPIDRYCEEGGLDLAQRLELFCQACAAVQVAHDHQVVHRDIKPSNLLVTADGTAKLLDFGIAKLLAPELMDQSVEHTAEFQRLMTPAFASPEQVRGDAVSAASDVYSLGVVLYRLLTGQHPYEVDESSREAIEQVVCGVQPVLPSRTAASAEVRRALAGPLDAIVAKALAKHPDQRFASAESLAQAIANAEVAPVRLPSTPAKEAIHGATPTPSEPGAEARGEQAQPGSEQPDPDFPTEDRIAWGHLEIIRKLGEGQFGEVFMCRDPALDMIVALKLFHRREGEGEGEAATPRLPGRILEEGRLLARVNHPNVVDVHGVAVHDETVGMWMEHIHGKTLADLLESQGRLSAREASSIGVDLCAALAAMHSQGVIHRDIKAQNVIREEGGRIVLMDFGAGRDTVDGKPAGRAAGTPLYMAPEVLRGEPATARSDLYSMGVLLCHLVTRAFPVSGASIAELIEKHDSGETPMLRDLRSDLPSQFARVVQRAIDPDPARRYATAGEMQQALEAAADLPLSPGESPTPLPDRDELDQERESIRRVARVATYLAYGLAVALFVTFIGFLGEGLKRELLDVPRDFELLNGRTAVEFGISSLFESAVWVVAWSLAFAVILVAARWSRRQIAKAAGRRPRLARIYQRLGAEDDLFERDPKTILVTVVVLGVAGSALVTLAVNDMINAFVALENPDQPGARLALFFLEDYAWEYKELYSQFFAALIVVLGFAAVPTFRRHRNARRPGPVTQWLRVAVIMTLMYAMTMIGVPWPLLFGSKHQAVLYQGTMWFIVAESETQYWLYSWDIQEGAAAEKSDPELDEERWLPADYMFGGESMTMEEILGN